MKKWCGILMLCTHLSAYAIGASQAEVALPATREARHAIVRDVSHYDAGVRAAVAEADAKAAVSFNPDEITYWGNLASIAATIALIFFLLLALWLCFSMIRENREKEDSEESSE